MWTYVFMVSSLLGFDQICTSILGTTGSWSKELMESISWDFGGDFGKFGFFKCPQFKKTKITVTSMLLQRP